MNDSINALLVCRFVLHQVDLCARLKMCFKLFLIRFAMGIGREIKRLHSAYLDLFQLNCFNVNGSLLCY